MTVTQTGNTVTVVAKPTAGTIEYNVPNPSFEDSNIDYWQYQNDLSFANAFNCTSNASFTCAHGLWFLAFKRNPVSYTDPYLTTDFFDAGLGDLSGKTFRLSFMSRGEFYPYQISSIGLQTEAVGGDWVNTSTYAALPTITVTPSVWQTYSFNVTFPTPAAGYTSSRMRIVLRAPNNDLTAYYDNIELSNVRTITNTQFYVTPYQTDITQSYCGATWTELPSAVFTPAYPPLTNEETWSTTWDVTGLGGQKFFVAANTWDQLSSCTGNPSGTCGTGFTGQCTGCRQTITICQTTCDVKCSVQGTPDGCGGFCSAGTDTGVPNGFSTVIIPDEGANIEPTLFTYTYPILLEYLDGTGKADYVEYVIFGQNDSLATQIINSTPTQLQALATTYSDRITYKRMPYTGNLQYSDTVVPKPTAGTDLRILTRAVNTSCSTEQYTAWDNHFFTLTGKITGELLNDPNGNCSGTSTLTLPSGTVTMSRRANNGVSSLVGYPTFTTLTNATNYQANLIPFTPDSNWSTLWGTITGSLVINNPDLANAYICSTCGNVGGLQVSNACLADYSQCICTISYPTEGLTTHKISAAYSPFDFYLQNVNFANDPWWQTWGGLVYSLGNIRSVSPISDVIPESCREDQQCDPHLIQTISGPNSSGTPDPARGQSAGIPIVGGTATITAGKDAGGFFDNRTNNERVTGGHNQSNAVRENYDYFAKTTDVNVPAQSDNNGSQTNINTLSELTAQATKQGDSVYSVPGNLTININITSGGKWNITGNTKHVIFIPGNLTIDVQNASTNADQQELINVDPGSFLGFIVGGNITVTENVGYSGDANLDALQTPNIEGMFVANGTITIKSYNVTNPNDRKFVGAGSYVGWTNVDLQRDFGDGNKRRELHATTPTETFIHRPDLLVNVPEILKRAQLTWQEVN
jgi:hypothetical protein